MSGIHRLLHESLLLSAPFATALASSAVALALLGLLLSRWQRFAAASRHLVLSVAVLAPLMAAVLAFTPTGVRLRSLLLPAGSAVPADVTPLVTTGAPAPVAPPRSEKACLLLALWAAGGAAFLAATALRASRWWRLAAAASPLTDNSALATFGAVATRLGVAPRLALSGDATEPMVVGFFRPTVVLPSSYPAALEPAELATVFAHELEHVRRRDNVTAMLHEVASALFWFDPLHWIARRRLLELRERACDEGVLELGCAARAYAGALARSCHPAIRSAGVACMSGFQVRERIDTIMNYSTLRSRFLPRRAIRAAVVVATLAAVAGLVAYSPAPAIAETPGEAWSLDVTVRSGPDGRVLIGAMVLAPDGERVMDAKATALAGEPVRLGTVRAGRTYQVDVTPSGATTAATLEVRDGSSVIYRTTKTVIDQREMIRRASGADPISLEFKDADVRDVLEAFRKLTGRKVVIDPAVAGKVTISIQDMPWDLALQRVAGMVGCSAEVDGAVIRVAPSKERRSEPERSAAPGGRSTMARAREEAGADGYLPVTGDIKAPEVLTRVQPVYTDEARAARVVGLVIVEAKIDATGMVRDTQVLKPLPFGLDAAAEAAVRQWVFAPALRDGRPVPVRYRVTLNFRLE